MRILLGTETDAMSFERTIMLMKILSYGELWLEQGRVPCASVEGNIFLEEYTNHNAEVIVVYHLSGEA